MKLKTVIYDKECQVATIKLNRPERLNAVNDELMKDIVTALEEARRDNEVRVVVIRGEGRSFSAGADVKEVRTYANMQEYREHVIGAQRIAQAVANLGKPIIAAVHGYALGAGCELALSCDIRIAAEGAKFGFPEVQVGGTVYTGGTYNLPRLVGVGKAKEMIFTTDTVDAQEAERIGLVNKVVSIEELDQSVMKMATKIANNFPLALKLARASINLAVESSLNTVLDYEVEASCVAQASGELDVGRKAQAKRITSE